MPTAVIAYCYLNVASMLMLPKSSGRPPTVLTEQVVWHRLFVGCDPETPGGAEHNLRVDVPCGDKWSTPDQLGREPAVAGGRRYER